MSATTNKTLRISTQLAERIDNNARRHGQNFTQYVLSWLPDTYDSTAEQQRSEHGNSGRVVRSRGESSPTRT